MLQDGPPPPRLLTLLCLLWLTGVSMRITILAVPPVIPLIHTELHLQRSAGRIPGEPAAAGVRACRGAGRAAGASARYVSHIDHRHVRHGRGGGRRAAAQPVVWTLFAATFVMGFGVAIMQPALPALVREWMPQRIALGAATSTNGLVMGGTLAPCAHRPAGAAARRQQLAARPCRMGDAGARDRAGVHPTGGAQHQLPRRRISRLGAALVAGLEGPAGVAARPDLRRQQRDVFTAPTPLCPTTW